MVLGSVLQCQCVPCLLDKLCVAVSCIMCSVDSRLSVVIFFYSDECSQVQFLLAEFFLPEILRLAGGMFLNRIA
jgi:hypothetical protein